MNSQVNVIDYDLSTIDQWSDEKLYMCMGYLHGQVGKYLDLGNYRLVKIFNSLCDVVQDEMRYRGLKVLEIE